MTAEAFDAYARGRTLDYSLEGGRVYGAERHGPGRRVVWRRLDEDACFEGVWFPRGENICFVYDSGVEGERCWRFVMDADGMTGSLADDPDGRTYGVERSDRALDCPGAPPIS